MEKQFKRFLELSLKFTKTKSEALGLDDNKYYTSLGLTTNIIYSGDINTTAEIKVKSTADLIREEAEKKAILAEEYEEYLELQKNLGDYFQATDKLNN